MKTIAVLGARGRLGRMVARAFLAQNWQVIAITRDGKAPDGLERAESRAADAMDRQALIAACEGADVIFNGLNPVYTAWQRFCATQADNVIAAAKANRALHLFAGNLYNYGPEIPALVDETTAMPGITGKGQIRNTMERKFKAAAGDGVTTLVLRAGDFYGGDGSGSWFDMAIAAKLDKGIFTWPGGTRPEEMAIDHSWAYLPDLAKAFVQLAETDCGKIGFQSYTFAGHTLSGAEMKRLVEQAVARPLKTASLPWWLLKAGGLVAPMWRELTEISYLWFRPHRLSGAKLEAAIGPVPATEPARAVAEALGALGHDVSGRLAA